MYELGPNKEEKAILELIKLLEKMGSTGI